MSGEYCRCRRCRFFRRCRHCNVIRPYFVCQGCLSADARGAAIHHLELENALAFHRERILAALPSGKSLDLSIRLITARRRVEMLRGQQEHLQKQLKNDQSRISAMRAKFAEHAARESAETFRDATNRRYRRVSAAWAAEKESICERREKVESQILEARRALVAELLACMRLSATPAPYGSVCGLPILLSHPNMAGNFDSVDSPPKGKINTPRYINAQSQESLRRQTNAALGYLSQTIILLSLYLGAPIPLSIHFGSSESWLSFHRTCPPISSRILSRHSNYMSRHVAEANAANSLNSASNKGLSSYPQWMSFVFEPLAANSASNKNLYSASQLRPVLATADEKSILEDKVIFDLLVDAPLRIPAKGISIAPFVQAASMLTYATLCLCAAFRVSVPPERILCLSSNILECCAKARSCLSTRYVISYGAVRSACVDALLHDLGANLNDFQEPQTTIAQMAKRNSESALNLNTVKGTRNANSGSSENKNEFPSRRSSPLRKSIRSRGSLGNPSISNFSSASMISSGSQSPPIRFASSSTSLTTEEDEWLVLPMKPSYSARTTAAVAAPIMDFSILNISDTSELSDKKSSESIAVLPPAAPHFSSNSGVGVVKRSRKDRHSLMISPLIDDSAPAVPLLQRSTSFPRLADAQSADERDVAASTESIRGVSFTNILYWGRRLFRDTISPNQANNRTSTSTERTSSGSEGVKKV